MVFYKVSKSVLRRMENFSVGGGLALLGKG